MRKFGGQRELIGNRNNYEKNQKWNLSMIWQFLFLMKMLR
jgi:hypothetical protein